MYLLPTHSVTTVISLSPHKNWSTQGFHCWWTTSGLLRFCPCLKTISPKLQNMCVSSWYPLMRLLKGKGLLVFLVHMFKLLNLFQNLGPQPLIQSPKQTRHQVSSAAISTLRHKTHIKISTLMFSFFIVFSSQRMTCKINIHTDVHLKCLTLSVCTGERIVCVCVCVCE